MVKKAEYELSEVITSIEGGQPNKIYKTTRTIRNLFHEDFYLLFIFTLFLSMLSVTIFINCYHLYSNYHMTIEKIMDHIDSFESTIEYVPKNISKWINHQSKEIESISNHVVFYAVERPTQFLNTTINQFVNVLNPLTGSTTSLVNLELSIQIPEIPDISLGEWKIDIPKDDLRYIMDVLLSIPYYFGVSCLVISILFISILFAKGLILYLDYQFRYNFLTKPSFWIGIIFSLLFFSLMLSTIYIHYRYVKESSQNIHSIEDQIQHLIVNYNHFMDENESKMSNLINHHINVIVNHTNNLVEQLSDLIETRLSVILSRQIELYFDKLDLSSILIRLDTFQIDPDIVDLSWIIDRIESIFIGFIILFAILTLFFVILLLCVCSSK
jgi:hypothetical protein